MGTLGYQVKPFNLPSDTFFGTTVNTVTGTTTPGTPPSGSAYVWYDSGIKKWRVKHSDGTIESLGVGTSGAAAHKDTHKDLGSDAFTKSDTLNCEARYLEDIADPSSDSHRIWMVNAGDEIRYWDDQTTPVKQSVATTGTSQTFSNKTLNSSCDISGALSSAGYALTNVTNTFTVGQEIIDDKNVRDQLVLKQSTNVVGDYAVLSSQILNSSSAYFNAGWMKWQLVTNTAGSESAEYYVVVRNAGTNITPFRIDNTGLLYCGGSNRRVVVSESGLTGARTITFQDSSYKVAGIDRANTYTSGNQVFQVRAEINKEITYTGQISPTQITADQNDYNPTNFLTSSVIRLDADSSMRLITGLGNATQPSGMRVRLRNISANTIMIMNQHGGSTAANRFDFGGYDYPLFSKCDVDLAYDGTLSRWVLNDPGTFVYPSANVGQYFSSERENMAAADGLFAAPTAASGGTATGIAGEAGHPGLTRLTLGTSATGTASVLANDIASLVVGNNIYTRFDAIIRINALSNATDRFTLRVGLIDSGTAEPTDGVYFRYVDNVNSGNWVLVARSNGTETVGNSTTAAATGFTKLTCIIYPVGTKADFFINDTFISASSSVTSNFPTGAGRDTAPGLAFVKSAGTTNNTGIDFDAFQLIQYHNVSR